MVKLTKPSEPPYSAAWQRLEYVHQQLDAHQHEIPRRDETVSATTETMGWRLIELRENVLAQYGSIQDEIKKSWNEFPILLEIIHEVPPARRAYRVNFLLKTLYTNYDAALEATVQTLEEIKQLALKIKQIDPSWHSKNNLRGLPTPESLNSAEEKAKELQSHEPKPFSIDTVDKFIANAFQDPQDRRIEVMFDPDDSERGYAAVRTMSRLFDDPTTRPERIVVPWSSISGLVPSLFPPVWQEVIREAQNHHIEVVDSVMTKQDKDKKTFVFRGDDVVNDDEYRYVVLSSPQGPAEEGTIEYLEPIQFNNRPPLRPSLSPKEMELIIPQLRGWVRWYE